MAVNKNPAAYDARTPQPNPSRGQGRATPKRLPLPRGADSTGVPLRGGGGVHGHARSSTVQGAGLVVAGLCAGKCACAQLGVQQAVSVLTTRAVSLLYPTITSVHLLVVVVLGVRLGVGVRGELGVELSLAMGPSPPGTGLSGGSVLPPVGPAARPLQSLVRDVACSGGGHSMHAPVPLRRRGRQKWLLQHPGRWERKVSHPTGMLQTTCRPDPTAPFHSRSSCHFHTAAGFRPPSGRASALAAQANPPPRMQSACQLFGPFLFLCDCICYQHRLR
jgi:hypothetical protein